MKNKATLFLIISALLLTNNAIPTLADQTAEANVVDSEQLTSNYNIESTENSFMPGQVIVGIAKKDQSITTRSPLFPGLNIVSVKSLTDNDGIELNNNKTRSIIKREILLLQLADTTEQGVLDAIEILQDNPDIAYAEPNYIASIGRAPNDSNYSQLWGMQKIQAPNAWNTTTGSRSVLVGVLDTGVDVDHPDLKNNVNVSLAKDFTGSNSGYKDIDGHGTHVSGTIGAEGNNGIGVAGINWKTSIVPIKVLDDTGYGYYSYFIAGINYAASKNIPIINMSLGGKGFSQAFKDSIDAYPGLLIAAAGNDSLNNDIKHFYPSDFDCNNIISVAATNTSDTLSNFSNYGVTTVDLAAPGSNIYSTVPNGKYESWQGTSMAAPHVAGAAALLKSYYPGLSTTQLKSIILSNVTKLESLNGKVATGGRLNLDLFTKDTVNLYKKTSDVNGDHYADYILPHRTADGKIGFVTFLATGAGMFHDGVGSKSNYFTFATDSKGKGTGMVADVNGDGNADYVMPVRTSDNMTGLVTFLSKGNGVFTDGFYSKSSYFGFATDSTGQGLGKMADVNNDGCADYIMPHRTTDGKIGFVTFLAKGDGTFHDGVGSKSNYFTFAVDSIGQGSGIMADVNGDGYSDYVMPVRTSEDMTGLVAFLSKGNGSFADGFYSKSSYFGFASDSTGQGLGKMADVNNDGCADYIMPHRTANGLIGFVTFLAKGDGTFHDGTGSKSNYFTFAVDSKGQGSGMMADVNGDGYSDYVMPVRTSDDTTGLVTFLSKGNGTFADGFYSKSSYFGFATDSTGRGLGKMADVNNDGYSDYIMPHRADNGQTGIVTFLAKGDGTFRDGIGFKSEHFGFAVDSIGQGLGIIN